MAMEEARNYDSHLTGVSGGSQKRNETDSSKLNDSSQVLATGVQGSLNVFKNSFNQRDGRNSALSNSNQPQTPQLGNSLNNSNVHRQVDETEDGIEEEEEYRDDDFENSSHSSAALNKVSVSQSGRLPPLSGSYPHGATEKSLSASFLLSNQKEGESGSKVILRESQEKKNSSSGTGGHSSQRNNPPNSNSYGMLNMNSSREILGPN